MLSWEISSPFPPPPHGVLQDPPPCWDLHKLSSSVAPFWCVGRNVGGILHREGPLEMKITLFLALNVTLTLTSVILTLTLISTAATRTDPNSPLNYNLLTLTTNPHPNRRFTSSTGTPPGTRSSFCRQCRKRKSMPRLPAPPYLCRGSLPYLGRGSLPYLGRTTGEAPWRTIAVRHLQTRRNPAAWL